MTTVLYVLWLFCMGLGFSGVIQIGYAVLAEYTGERWTIIERWGTFTSALLTLIGVVLTAGSIYVPQLTMHPPWPGNELFVSPLVIGGSVLAAIVLFRTGQLPPNLVSGFALLAISGGLLRIVPLPFLLNP